jgi:protein-S-isoprenylcysteine O-methyltransferase Ste14
MSEANPTPAVAPGAAKPPSKTWLGRLWHWLQRTPVRTFVIYPVVVVAFELVWRGGELTFMPVGLVLLIWGYLQYRIVGSYRRRHGGGGPGFDVPPQRIVSDGPYRYTRNPMYLGHLIFMAGLALTFWSWLALVILLVNVLWFHLRVLRDEKKLMRQFGAPYADYCQRVKRWVPGAI